MIPLSHNFTAKKFSSDEDADSVANMIDRVYIRTDTGRIEVPLREAVALLSGGNKWQGVLAAIGHRNLTLNWCPLCRAMMLTDAHVFEEPCSACRESGRAEEWKRVRWGESNG